MVSLLQDAVVMLVGTIMLAVATGTTSNGWVIMYATSQLVFGFGVGGKHDVMKQQHLCIFQTDAPFDLVPECDRTTVIAT